MRKATTIKPIMWRKARFKKLTPKAKLLFLFLLTGPDTNLSGLLTYSTDEIVMFTGLSVAEVKKAFEELELSGRLLIDEENEVILVLRWIEHNPLKSPKQVIGALNQMKAYENHEFYQIAEQLVHGADADTLSIHYQQGIYTPQGQGQGSSLKILKKKTPKKDDGSAAIAEAMTKEWNSIFGGNRGTTSSLITAIKAVLKDDDSLTPEDFALVVRSRATEEWVIKGKLPIESLIRAGKFAGFLEVAKETHTPSPGKSEKLRMMDEVAKRQGASNV